MAKVLQERPMSGGGWMRRRLRTLIVTALMGSGVGTLAAQETHEIRMEENEKRNEFAFVPAQVTARPGDVLVFRAVNGAPHSVVFEAGGLTGPAHEALNAAMPRRSSDLGSPLLTKNGAEYRFTVPALPKGTYRFFCLPHRAYDERGQLTVK
jgi:plastocyanin